MEEVEEFNTEPRKRNDGFSGNNLWIETRSDKAPFKLGFYMMTISVNVSLSSMVNNNLYAGLDGKKRKKKKERKIEFL